METEVKSLWLKEGDNYTRIFHWLADLHRRNNFIGKIEVEWEEFSDNRMGEEIVHFY